MSNIIIILSVLIPLIVLALIVIKLHDESKIKLSEGFYYFLPDSITDDATFKNLEFIGSQKDYCTFKHIRGYEVRLEHKYVKLMKLH